MVLFLIRHTHSPEGCPCSKEVEAAREFWESLSEQNASKVGVRIISSHISPTPTEHALVLVVDAEDRGKVEAFTSDRLALGETKITPAWTIKEAVERH